MTTFAVTSIAQAPTSTLKAHIERLSAHVVRFTDTELAFVMCVLAFPADIACDMSPSPRVHSFLARTWGLRTVKGRPHYNRGKGRGHAVKHLCDHHGAIGFESATAVTAAVQ